MSKTPSATPDTNLDRRKFLEQMAGITASLLITTKVAKGQTENIITENTISQSVDTIQSETFALPPVDSRGQESLEAVLKRRRSRRKYSGETLTIAQLSQLLWASQGVTGQDFGTKLRSAPSAGALYPLDVYAVMHTGVFHYLPLEHKLIRTQEGDKRVELAIAALGQEFVAASSVDFVITAEYERSMVKYQQRGIRYSVIEVGHVSQNIYLQAEALGLATVAVGAFDDGEVQRTLKLPERHRPLIIMPTGVRRGP